MNKDRFNELDIFEQIDLDKLEIDDFKEKLLLGHINDMSLFKKNF
ncbi:hypothetical protein [Terrisporobacter hibernicus]|nr:hypothetical protein [Terrisporobacter hibernicus]